MKHEVCYYLKTRKDVVKLFWVNKSVGIYDAKKGCYRRDNSRFSLNGVSDILGVLVNGKILAIELKSKRGVLTIEQKIFLDEINKAGGCGFVARSREDVEKHLNEFLLVVS